jgi:hypothetical protein
MPVSVLFWILWVLALILGFGWTLRTANGNYVGAGGSLLYLVLLGLLGWQVFGFILTK